jgi:hypothetical protein
MKKVRYIAGLAGLAPAAAAAMTGTVAHAASAGDSPGHHVSTRAKTVSLRHLPARAVSPDLVYHCYGSHSGFFDHCNAPIIGSTAVFSAGGNMLLPLHSGDRVEVTCWYRSSAHNRIQDHVIREHIFSTYYHSPGHVSDRYVNFSKTNPSGVGLAHC